MGEAAIKNLPAEDIFQANPLPAAFFVLKNCDADLRSRIILNCVIFWKSGHFSFYTK
jgi:hypothetical protein